ncbi:hypothetical protein Q9R29_08465 [Rothia sp. ARF10]|nr:hypothetical protein [Rothia sp. ARF10]
MTKTRRRTPARANTVSRVVIGHWEKLAAVASVLTAATAAVVYAVTLNANTLFAAGLGVTTDDLGVTQTGLIASALMYAIVLGLLCLLVAASFGMGRSATYVTGRHAAHRWPTLKGLRTPWPTPGLSLTGWVKLLARIAVRMPLILIPPLAMVLLLLALGRGSDDHVGFATVAVWMSVALGSGVALTEILTTPQAPPAETKDVNAGLAGHETAAMGLAVLVVVTVVAYLVVNGLSSSAAGRARALLRGPAGQVETSGFADPFLAGQRSATRLVALTGADPLGVCDGKKVATLVSASAEANVVIVYPDAKKAAVGVYRLPRDLYGVVTGMTESVPCTFIPKP